MAAAGASASVNAVARLAVRVVFVGAFLVGCEGVGEVRRGTETGASTVWEPVAGIGGSAGTTLAGTGGAPFPGDAVDASVMPGPMPPAPDGGVAALTDASSPAAKDSSVDLSTCTPPPADASDTAIRAWTLLNELRLAAGAGCMNMVAELNQSAQSHCDYKVTNASNPSCATDAHSEITGCPGFTGANVQAREIAAGYPQQLAYTEVALTYGDNPELAIPNWLATPYHRIPMMDPWTTDMGWGGATDCDVIDIGRGSAIVPDTTVVVYPYDGQTEVPPTFNGLEAPAPPQPAGGWPSSYPISIYARQLSVTSHTLTKDGDPTPLAHTWLDTANPGSATVKPYFGNTAVFYGAAFEPMTTYRVKIVGTHAGGALDLEWTFTTGAASPPGF